VPFDSFFPNALSDALSVGCDCNGAMRCRKNISDALSVRTYGNVDGRYGVRKGYVYVRGQRLQSLCRKLGIRFAQALIEFGGKKRFGYHPIFDGVVVSARSASKLLAAIKEREERAHSPAAVARKE
jgi:Rad4 beta-hairpin domain 3